MNSGRSDFSEIQGKPSSWRCSALGDRVNEQVLERLESIGFVVVTDLELPPSDLERAKRTVLHFGRRFGSPLWQDDLGTLVWVVRDEMHRFAPDPRNILDVRNGSKSSKSSDGLGFHSDGAARWLDQDVDLMGLFAVRTTSNGGDTKLLDTRALFDVLASEAPDAANRLSRPLPFDRSANRLPEQSDISWHPMFSWEGSTFRARFNPARLVATMRDHPHLRDDSVIAAVDVLNTFVERPEFQLTFHLEAGECIFVDERKVAHGRTGFSDPERTLLRIWLNA